MNNNTSALTHLLKNCSFSKRTVFSLCVLLLGLIPPNGINIKAYAFDNAFLYISPTIHKSAQIMAKSLLLNILVEYLGTYVEGLSSENLQVFNITILSLIHFSRLVSHQVGVWSGKVELHNLKLKSTALDNLHLPIKVTRGSLKKVSHSPYLYIF